MPSTRERPSDERVGGQEPVRHLPAGRSTDRGREACLVQRKQGRDGCPGRRKRFGQVGHRAVHRRPSRPTTPTVSGSVRYRGTQMVGASERALRKVRGNDISFIFQEPMTSLNPLHTIEKQIAESLALHQGLTGDTARARVLELLAQVGIRDAEEPPRRLSAPALRRPAPAGDDRHGAGQRPRPPDRRRAHHRARRHHPGPDPRPPRRHPEGRGHGDALHHPRPRHRPPHRRPGRGDAGRRDRRDRAPPPKSSPTRSTPTPACSSPPSRPAAPTRSPPVRPTIVETEQSARLVPDPARAAAPDRRPRQGGERRDRRHPRRRDPRRRRRVRLGQDHARAGDHAADLAPRAASSSSARTSRAGSTGRAPRACAATCRWSSRTPTARSRPA